MHNFERLLTLAQKTKSSLIAYDRHGDEHFVIVGIDDFESLHGINQTPKPLVHPPEPEFDVTDDVASDALLLEKINRDIANWRSSHEQKEHKNAMATMVEELDHDGQESEISETVPTPKFERVDENIVEEVPKEDFKEISESKESVESIPKPQPGNSPWTPFGQVLAKTYPQFKKPVDISSEVGEIKYDQITEPRIPILPATGLDDETVGSEEPLADDPVFLEEPVE